MEPDITAAIKRVSEAIDGEIRTSAKGILHIVVSWTSPVHSVCYFRKTNQWKVFYPYPSSKQSKLRFLEADEVIGYFDRLKEITDGCGAR